MGTFVDSSRSLLLLAGCIICTNVAGVLGSFVTETGPGSWYAEELVKPWFLPPPLAFPVVWTTLYILMGIALYLVLRKGFEDGHVRVAGGIFGVQLALNIAWSYAFFGMQSPLAGLFVICALWGAIVASIWSFYRIDRVAAYLLVPYIVWVSFAAIINAAIYLLN
ncbi:TspO protein [Methanomicrobiaceae archaeon CYW5]|uniref:TspO/MBR family protein n=1 Tax=Methanovulcanius yangii TaxID=1789227 RepID=UPI0029CA7842|nr:TspO/MBR family protein [Methanovulcanius yangii]MBT8507773.1 TspO protein [Methanovulcanius yangii]